MYGEEYDDLDEDGYPYLIHEEDYSCRPLPENAPQRVVWSAHHPECTYDPEDVDTCICRSLYEKKAEADEEAAAEDMHAEWWQ
jgi:hypothetical protein